MTDRREMSEGKPTMRLLLAAPRGFCAGVEMAIACLEKALELYEIPIYVYHQIVHNKCLVDRYERRGVVFVDCLEAVPPRSVLLFSAHGVTPGVREEAARRELTMIDTTCPLVTKVHAEAKQFAKDGRLIFFIGHHDHDEAVGVIGEAPDKIITLESIDYLDNLTLESADVQTAYLTQTTLSMDDTEIIISALRKRFPDIQGPRKSDICYATQNRQEAVRTIVTEAEMAVVIGSRHSSNSQRLAELARTQGKPTYLIDGADEIDFRWFDGVGTALLTAGASVPEERVQEVVVWLKQKFDLKVEERVLKEESLHFQLPVELRRPRRT